MTQIPESSLPEQVASQAELIVNTLQQTKYTYDENINPAGGIYDCDCSAFVSFVLAGVAPIHYGAIVGEIGHSPLAFEYYEFVDSLTQEPTEGWHRIHLLADALRGDIIAWRFPTIEVGHDTGHVMIAAETPTVDDSGVFWLRVYDSADYPHFDDTRGDGGFTNGVGSGIIKFLVNDAGAPSAFQFAPSEEFTYFPIAIGRLEP
jgi:hypothetical protein